MIITWSDQDIDAMSIERASALREEMKNTLIASDVDARRSTFRLLAALDRKVSQAPASVEQRAATAREFLHPAKSDATRQRAWDVAVELHGGEREASRRGYVNPEAA